MFMPKGMTRRIMGLLWLLLFSLTFGGRLIAAADAACDIVVAPPNTIQTAINEVANDQVICVRDGEYQEAVLVPAEKTGLTLRAYEGETPIIDGNKRIPSDWITNQNVALVEIMGDGTLFEGF